MQYCLLKEKEKRRTKKTTRLIIMNNICFNAINGGIFHVFSPGEQHITCILHALLLRKVVFYLVSLPSSAHSGTSVPLTMATLNTKETKERPPVETKKKPKKLCGCGLGPNKPPPIKTRAMWPNKVEKSSNQHIPPSPFPILHAES